MINWEAHVTDHMLDAVVIGMFPPWNEIAFTNTNTISGVLCIAAKFVWCLVLNSSGETVPTQLYQKMLINFWQTFVLLYLDTILYSDTQNYMNFLDSNMQWLSFEFNLHLSLLHLVGCVLLCHYVYHMCVS